MCEVWQGFQACSYVVWFVNGPKCDEGWGRPWSDSLSVLIKCVCQRSQIRWRLRGPMEWLSLFLINSVVSKNCWEDSPLPPLPHFASLHSLSWKIKSPDKLCYRTYFCLPKLNYLHGMKYTFEIGRMLWEISFGCFCCQEDGKYGGSQLLKGKCFYKIFKNH